MKLTKVLMMSLVMTVSIANSEGQSNEKKKDSIMQFAGHSAVNIAIAGAGLNIDIAKNSKFISETLPEALKLNPSLKYHPDVKSYHAAKTKMAHYDRRVFETNIDLHEARQHVGELQKQYQRDQRILDRAKADLEETMRGLADRETERLKDIDMDRERVRALPLKLKQDKIVIDQYLDDVKKLEKQLSDLDIDRTIQKFKISEAELKLQKKVHELLAAKPGLKQSAKTRILRRGGPVLLTLALLSEVAALGNLGHDLVTPEDQMVLLEEELLEASKNLEGSDCDNCKVKETID